MTDVGTAWTAFQRMRQQLTARINRELAQTTGLSEADYDVLYELDRAEDKSLRALALRCGLAWAMSRLSLQIRRMENRGLVVRDTCAEDGRGATVALTDQGRETIRAARARHAEAVDRFFGAALTAEQLAAMEGISSAVLDTLGDGAEGVEHATVR